MDEDKFGSPSDPRQPDDALRQVVEGPSEVFSAPDHVGKHDTGMFDLRVSEGENGDIVNLRLGDEAVEISDVGEIVRRVARASRCEGGGRHHHVQGLQNWDESRVHRRLDPVDPSLEGRRWVARSWPVSLRNDP